MTTQAEHTDELVVVDIAAENTRFMLKSAIAGIIMDEVKADRVNHLGPLLDEYRRSGNKSFAVKLPDGSKLGAVTLPEGQDATAVTDDTAFFLWMKENHPEEIETITEPEKVIPARVFEQVKPAALARFLDAGWARAGEAIITADGEPVPGVSFIPAPEPKSFTVTFAGKTAADKAATKRALIAAYQRGDFGHLDMGAALPQIGS